MSKAQSIENKKEKINMNQNSPVYLTREYLDSHAVMAHNFESFGRAVAAALLEKAKQHPSLASAAPVDEVTLEEKITIKSVPERLCVYISILGQRVHVGVDI